MIASIFRYMDNFLRVYCKDKDKEKDMTYFIYVYNQIRCIRNRL